MEGMHITMIHCFHFCGEVSCETKDLRWRHQLCYYTASQCESILLVLMFFTITIISPELHSSSCVLIGITSCITVVGYLDTIQLPIFCNSCLKYTGHEYF